MAFLSISLLNGLSYGLLLFMLSAGLTLIFSMMGVLNFAHASFYMLGAYVAYSAAQSWGFWPSLLVAPLVVGVLGALFERFTLRKTYRFGHVPDLLVTFGLSYILLELVQLVWGRSSLSFEPPEVLRGPAFTLVQDASDTLQLFWGVAPADLCHAVGTHCSLFPANRAFMMGVALLMLLLLWLLLQRTRTGLVIQAALTHPDMVQSLGHNVPRVFTLVFGVGTGLAGLAGVIGGSTFVLEPGMAATVGSILFVVVVVGGMGSLPGAFLASLLIGLLQTFAIAFDQSFLSLLQQAGLNMEASDREHPVLRLTLSQLAPILPYLLLVGVLVLRPRGLMGTREA
jgi:branched-chain amino acid transport system permease protein